MMMMRAGWPFVLVVCWIANQIRADEPKALQENLVPDFEQLVVTIEPLGLPSNGIAEELRIESTGVCWYKAKAQAAFGSRAARNGAVFQHSLSRSRIRRLNLLLEETKWLTAEGAEGRATHTHPTTIKILLKRNGKQFSVTCEGQRPKPYAALLHELEGIAAQERRIYLKNYVEGQDGIEAWQEISRELAALRGEPYGKSQYDIEYDRYLPEARRIVHDFHSKPDDELVPAIRLIAYLEAKAELPYLHRLADDRSSRIRQEVAMALGRIHEHESLPVLVAMMSASGTSRDVGFELIQWGDDAVPAIVKLIERSTDGSLDEKDRVMREDMIRAYLDNWKDLPRPINREVIAAVRKAMDAKDPLNGTVRIDYHREFLKRAAAN